MDDFVQSVQDKKNNIQAQQEAAEKHSQLVNGSEAVKSAILEAARATIESTVSHQPMVDVKNFPEKLATSDDVERLISVLEQSQSSTEDTTKNTTESLRSTLTAILSKLDMISQQDHTTDVLSAMASLEEEVKDKEMTVTNLDDLGNFFYELQNAIESKDLTVNVEAPQVNVEAPDLSPIKDLSADIMTVKEAIEAQEFPDHSGRTVEELQEANSTLKKILARPIPVPTGGANGGGGGGTPVRGYNYIDVQQTSATVETYVFKEGGSTGTTVETIVVTYTDSTKSNIDEVTYA